MIKNQLKIRVVKSVGWSTIDRWANRFLSFIVIAILARMLDAQAFGLLAAALIFTEYLEMFVSQGIGFAIVQRKVVEDGHLNAAFWLNTLSGAVLSIFLWMGSPIIAAWFGKIELTNILKSLSPLLFISGISRIQAALLTKDLKFKEIAIRNISGQIAGSAVGIVMAYIGFGVWSLVGQQAVKAIVGNAVLWIACKWRPGISMEFRHAKDLYSYGYKVFADQQVLYFASRLDEGLIGYYLDAASLGFYSIAKRLVAIFFDLFNSPIHSVTFPIFANIQTDLKQITDTFSKGVKIYLSVTLPVFAGLAAFSEESVRLVFGDHWILSAPAVSLLAIAGPFHFAPIFVHSLFQAVGGPVVPLSLNTLRAGLSLILFPIGSFFGILGMASAFTMKAVLGAICDLVFLKVLLKIPVGNLLWRVKTSLVLTILMLAIAFWVNHFLTSLFGGKTAIFATVFVSFGWYLIGVMIFERPLVHDVAETIYNIICKK